MDNYDQPDIEIQADLYDSHPEVWLIIFDDGRTMTVEALESEVLDVQSGSFGFIVAVHHGEESPMTATLDELVRVVDASRSRAITARGAPRRGSGPVL